MHYFLYEYELSLQGNEEQKITYDTFVKRNSIEHIFPQTAVDECWQTAFDTYSNEQRVKLKNSLGNLLLLSVPKNAHLQNKCFDYKKRHPTTNNPNEFKGYFNGSHSEIEVNAYPNWTAKEILERGVKMLNFMERRWEMRIGNFDQKKKILFVEFLQIGEHELNLA
ncbi:GmrSD restriction endonuclease domain-containing protein [Algoriphagus boritolerans]|uniref:GmrSD restriction endonuclease domain-containing protein n=1 Tax=Algoriphagus boritolerans TaxID=308111 RepID=UPI003A103366